MMQQQQQQPQVCVRAHLSSSIPRHLLGPGRHADEATGNAQQLYLSLGCGAGCSRAAFAQIAAKQQQQQPGLYKDLAWADPSPVLFCGGASTQLDVYNVC